MPASSFGFDHAKHRRTLERRFGKHVETVFTVLHERILAHSPVNSGSLVASWRASKSAPDTTTHPGFGIPSVPSSQLPLGAEENRPMAVAVSRLTRRGIDFQNQPFDKYYLSNSVEADPIADSEYDGASRAVLVEYGAIPNTRPGTLLPAAPRAQAPVRLALREALRVAKRT